MYKLPYFFVRHPQPNIIAAHRHTGTQSSLSDIDCQLYLPHTHPHRVAEIILVHLFVCSMRVFHMDDKRHSAASNNPSTMPSLTIRQK